jgi:carbon monoxide dehydrogenase subunit G
LIKSNDVKKYGESIRIQLVMFAAIFVVTIAFLTLPQVFAISLNASREISAPPNQVWNIISNVDKESQYWSSFKAIKNINKTDNMIEREVTISAGPQNTTTTSHQLVTVYPEQLKIQTNLTKGLVTGSRILELKPISDNKSKIDVLWNLDLSGIPIADRALTENATRQTTEQALSRIAQATEYGMQSNSSGMQ